MSLNRQETKELSDICNGSFDLPVDPAGFQALKRELAELRAERRELNRQARLRLHADRGQMAAFAGVLFGDDI